MSLRKHTIWNLAGNGLPLLAGLACIPYTLAQLGYEAFGILTLVWSLIGYFSLFDLGVGRALTYEISGLIKENKNQQIPNALVAGLILTLLTGAIGGTVVFLLAEPMVALWLKVEPQMQLDAELAFKISACGIIFTTLTSGLRGTQEALGRFNVANINKIFLGSCMFALPALVIWLHGPHLWIIALYLVVARAITFIASCIQLRHFLWVRTTLDGLTRQMRPLFAFGGWVSVSGVVSPLMTYGDRFFIGALVGSASLPAYAIPQEALQRLLILPISYVGALLPKITKIDKNILLQRYTQSTRRMGWIMLAVCLLAALASYPAFSWWITPEFAELATPIAVILSLGIWLNSLATIPYTFLHSLGCTKITALIHCAELFFYLVLLYFSVMLLGLPGAALAWTIRVGLDLFLLRWAFKNAVSKLGVA